MSPDDDIMVGTEKESKVNEESRVKAGETRSLAAGRRAH